MVWRTRQQNGSCDTKLCEFYGEINEKTKTALQKKKKHAPNTHTNRLSMLIDYLNSVNAEIFPTN